MTAATAHSHDIRTVVGTGEAGYSGDGGLGWGFWIAPPARASAIMPGANKRAEGGNVPNQPGVTENAAG